MAFEPGLSLVGDRTGNVVFEPLAAELLFVQVATGDVICDRVRAIP